MNDVLHVVAMIDERLGSMTRDGAVRRWGTPESLEAQVIQLLEVRQALVAGPEHDRMNVRRLRAAMVLERRGGNRQLCAVVSACDMPRVLKDLVDQATVPA